MGNARGDSGKSSVVVHSQDVLHNTEIFSACTLLFDSVLTYLPMITRSQFDELSALSEKDYQAKPISRVVKSIVGLKPFFKAETLTTWVPTDQGVGRERVDHVVYDFCAAICRGQHPLSEAVRAGLPEHWTQNVGSLIEFMGLHLVEQDRPLEVEILLGAALQFISIHANLPQFILGGNKSVEAGVLARFSRSSVPILRGAAPEQLLKAREVLKDELHPLRLELKKVALMVADEHDCRAVDATIAKELTPLVTDYRKSFESRRSTLLSATQQAAKELYTGVFTFGAALFATGDAVASSIAGLAAPAFDAAVRYATGRLAVREKMAKHPFGFLHYIEKGR